MHRCVGVHPGHPNSERCRREYWSAPSPDELARRCTVAEIRGDSVDDSDRDGGWNVRNLVRNRNGGTSGRRRKPHLSHRHYRLFLLRHDLRNDRDRGIGDESRLLHDPEPSRGRCLVNFTSDQLNEVSENILLGEGVANVIDVEMSIQDEQIEAKTKFTIVNNDSSGEG